MSHVYTRTDSGLLVAETRHGREAVADALKDYDRDLRLVPSVDPKHQTVLWKVYAYRGPDRPALFVVAWAARDGEPLPLSMRLLDMVKEQDRNTRSPSPDEDTRNARMVNERRQDSTDAIREIVSDMVPRIQGKRLPVLHRGQHLNRSRHKQPT